MISDFYEAPERIIRTIEPLRFHGNEVVLFHVLDPQEIRPGLDKPVILVDLETRDHMEVTPEYARDYYRDKIERHISRAASIRSHRRNGLPPARHGPPAR